MGLTFLFGAPNMFLPQGVTNAPDYIRPGAFVYPGLI